MHQAGGLVRANPQEPSSESGWFADQVNAPPGLNECLSDGVFVVLAVAYDHVGRSEQSTLISVDEFLKSADVSVLSAQDEATTAVGRAGRGGYDAIVP